ncbi:MAG: YihY/virulence factor BrkB family protein [Polyangiaceae bacterium]|nr:YihY/virulence factor BrkB family protein [Polyangiaceae bacterium]
MYKDGVLIARSTAFLTRLRRRLVSIILALIQHEAVHHASAMAFWLFLGLVPLVAILGWSLAKYSGTQFRQPIIDSITHVTPEPALELVNEQMRRLEGSTEAIAPLSVLGFLWIASGGIHTAIDAIQKAQTGRERGWIYNRALALGFVFALMLAAISSTTLHVVASPTWREVIRGVQVEDTFTTIWQYASLPTSTMVAVLGCAAFFRLSMIKTDSSIRKRVWPGALVTGASWVTVSWGFSLYARTIGRYPVFYGSLAAVALLMLWLWIVSFLVLLGSEVNLQIEGTRLTIAPTAPEWLRNLHIPAKMRKVGWISRISAPPGPTPDPDSEEPPPSEVAEIGDVAEVAEVGDNERKAGEW